MAKKKLTGAAARRRNLPISLNDGAQEVLKQARRDSGMPMTEILERVLRWFAAQDDVVRATVLGSIPEALRVDVARLTLERMAAKAK